MINILRLTGVMRAGETTRIRYSIMGEVDGLAPNSPFWLNVNTDPFEITENPDFILGMPPVIRQQYGLFMPRGIFKANATIKKTNQTAQSHTVATST